METLIPDLYSLMLERCSNELNFCPEYREYRQLRKRFFTELEVRMGPDFAQKLGETLDDGARLEAEAAFAWGLRLGLALERL